ncbi:MAG TPA: hypothetical protein VHL31_19135 [Geminicoccus sp.]|jgi:hypothetical protein|uniref:hypothetical protein n=1 Tax=Geminicoccus sp. TaxID=2024832 RepID=UPI002E2FD170|nr:hypothetical protein [Geminicoccus sp.]HEX2528401.1 hypothetical protein [Geminicoccus sp.]
MIELLIVACLLTGECKEVRLTYDAQDVSLLTCSLFGQMEAARWQRQHPEWQVRRWRCGVPRQEDARA